MNHISHHVDGQVHEGCLPGKQMAPACSVGRRKAGKLDALSNVLLAFMYFDMFHLAKHFCRSSTPLQDDSIPFFFF